MCQNGTDTCYFKPNECQRKVNRAIPSFGTTKPNSN